MTCTCSDTKQCRPCISRAYRERNAEGLKATRHAYYERHADRLKEAQRNRVRSRTKDENRRRALQDRNTPEKFLTSAVRNARLRSEKAGLDFDIDAAFLIALYREQGGRCALTGETMTIIVGQGRQRSNISLDRVDPRRGYTRDNTQLVTDLANTLKQNLSIDELRDICKRIVDNLGG